MRFDDEGYLSAWKATGAYPAIHDDLYQLVREEAEGLSFLDLCCSTGLLGERIRTTVKGAQVVGVDADTAAAKLADQYGVGLPIMPLQVDEAHLPALLDVIYHHQVTVLIARRCLPEILSPRMGWAPTFFSCLREAGVRELFLQGRLLSARSKGPLPSIDHEVQVASRAFRMVIKRGQLAYLVAR